MYLTMKTFVETKNYFLTSTIIFIHILTVSFTSIFEIIIILTISLLNAAIFHVTDEDKFISSVVQVIKIEKQIKNKMIRFLFSR